MSLDDTLSEIARRIAERKLYNYAPYDWQQEFHDAGADYPERMLMAANRVGKTESAAAECGFHLTGEYPEGWKGKRFNQPILLWTGSPTNETSRDIVQKALLGGTGYDLGTGFVPKARLVGKPKMRQAGVSDVADTFRVRHVSGGVSQCVLKTYEQGWRKWQGTAPHVVWMDEEPEDNDQQRRIFSEVQTRILTSRGIVMVTFTPLLGDTDLVRHFKYDDAPGVYLRTATWDDAPHLDEEEKKRLMASYPEHELDARTKGVPMMGEGAVFPVKEEDIKVEPIQIPPHFARIKGIDFGISEKHYGTGASLAWDRDQDVIYVYRVYRAKGQTAVYHAREINANDPWVPIAWPHDGMNTEKVGGKVLHKAFRAEGATAMLGMSARYDNKVGGSQPVEPIVHEVLERMQTGRFKVFETCGSFFEEMRNYHRKDGKIIAKRDDVLKAVFYAVMMRRYAMPEHTPAVRQAYHRAVVSA